MRTGVVGSEQVGAENWSADWVRIAFQKLIRPFERHLAHQLAFGLPLSYLSGTVSFVHEPPQNRAILTEARECFYQIFRKLQVPELDGRAS